jgi:hypothetical protein
MEKSASIQHTTSPFASPMPSASDATSPRSRCRRTTRSCPGAAATWPATRQVPSGESSSTTITSVS